ncbi:MAG: hypothetical protein KIT18_09985 [Burkholderiales bacterium]|nr:hypothetical protein [Burkholderiales bacterium]
MEKAGIDVRRPTLVAREFNRRYLDKPVSMYGVRKWLTGESIPSQDKVVVLAAWLGVSPEWLRFGPTTSTPATQLQQAVASFESDDLVFFRNYRKLTSEHRLAVREVTLTLLRVQSRRSG